MVELLYNRSHTIAGQYIPRKGNCLLRTMAHQIYEEIITQQEQNSARETKRAVNHVRQNI